MEDNFVIRPAEIRQIIIETCRNVVGSRRYDHLQAGEWNSTIIVTILNRLIQELDRQRERRFKLIVNSSIAQTIGPASDPSSVTTRGLHVANAAYWDPPQDGMFSHKYAADKDRDFDVIVSVVWLSHDGYTAPAALASDLDGRPPHVVA